MKKGYVYTIVFMLIISAVFTFVLAFANTLLKPRIDANATYAKQVAILDSVGVKAEGNAEEVAALFEAQLEEAKSESYDYYVQKDENGSPKAYAVPFTGSGLWGTIRGYAGVSEDKNTLLGIVFTEQNETPGLGGRISEDWFRDQFRGLSLAEGAPQDYGQVGDKQIDAITGATQTSDAIIRILKQLVEKLLPELEVA